MAALENNPQLKQDLKPKPQLWVLNFVALVGTMAIMSFVAVVGPVARLLGLADWHAGLALTAGGVLWMLSARRWGKLSDKVGRKRVLLISLAAYAITYLVLAVSVDFALTSPPAIAVSLAILVGTRALVGLFYAAVPTITAAAVADQVAPGKRASAMAKLGTANAIGLVAGPMLAGWIAMFDMALALYVATAMPVLAMIMIAWKLPETKPTLLAAAQAPNTLTPTKPAAKIAKVDIFDSRLRLPLAAVFVALVAVAITQATVGFLVIDRFSLSLSEGAKTAGYALTAIGGGLIFSQSLMMRIQWSPTRWLLIGCFLASAGFGAVVLPWATVLGAAWSPSVWPMLSAFVLAGMGMGLVRPAVQALTADCVEAHEQGAAAGTVASMQGFAMIVGPLAGTLLYRVSPAAPYSLVVGLLLLLAVAVWRHHAREVSHRNTGVIS
ncbi:MFS transporter [Oceanisphaera avium]|uniref:MFS transporter n=1 Tax=Oceanisphaera avium TaxID=1903694 RepID=A0A1Y0CXD5_9GAMM|nr:MFS transporter [Oceanisphaera avium]ART79674.1 MFS transporter [Oceanisphaera avium]